MDDDAMLTIGDFARLGQVSPRMLRHYDEIGLLSPDRVDPATGYRYYAAHQLARLHRLVALRDLGFNLEQIGPVLDEDLTVDELRGMLRMRREQARLRRVEAHLRALEGSDSLDVSAQPLRCGFARASARRERRSCWSNTFSERGATTSLTSGLRPLGDQQRWLLCVSGPIDP
jgi:DNA-binding transcriptional MerR regulator